MLPSFLKLALIKAKTYREIDMLCVCLNYSKHSKASVAFERRSIFVWVYTFVWVHYRVYSAI